MRYSDVFEKSFLFILKWEGGYVNDPNDPGGETKYGISKKAYPDLDIKHLTIDDAKEIYYQDYWIKASCTLIEQYSERLAFFHFNTSVNLGCRRAIKLLQKSIKQQGFSIKIDGIFGNQTLLNLKQSNLQWLYDTYCISISSYYIKLTQQVSKLRKFLRGWLNRTIDAYEFGLENFKT